jgi:hypothetical protein
LAVASEHLIAIGSVAGAVASIVGATLGILHFFEWRANSQATRILLQEEGDRVISIKATSASIELQLADPIDEEDSGERRS